jgi:DsbC/DsbD-like thiol-disulfide interchange protein
MKKFLLFAPALFLFSCISAQKPAKVSIGLGEHADLKAGDKVMLEIKVEPNNGWHVYSAIPSEEQVYRPAVIEYDISSVGFEAAPEIKEKGFMVTEFDDVMDGTMRYYKTPVVYSQELKMTEGELVVKGTFDYMACDDEKCLMFTEEFEVKP